MRKSLIMICGAALLTAGLAGCNRGGNDDDARLNNAATMLDDNGVFDTSADDAALNQAEVPTEEGSAGNGAAANAAAPAGSTAGNGQ